MDTRRPRPAARRRRRGRRRPNYGLRRTVAVALLFVTVFSVQAGARRLFADAPAPAAATADRSPAGATAQGETPAPRRRYALRVVSHPSGAALTIESAARTVAATTPYRGRVLGGTVALSLTAAGHNDLTEEITLERPRTVELWLDPEGLLHHKVAEFSSGSLPKQVAFSPDGRELWVTPLGESGIEIYNWATGRRIAEIPTGGHGTVEIVFTSDGKTAYVSQMQTASVFEIDRRTRRIRRRVRTGSAWSKVMVLSSDEQRLYVANWSGNNVSEIDLATGKVRRQLPTVATPRGLYVTPDGERLFVAGFEHGELERIDLHSGRSKVLLRTDGALRHLVGDVDGRRLYADDMATDEAYVVDLGTETVDKLADTDHSPNTMDVTPDGKVLYVSNRGANNPAGYNLPGPEWGTVLAIDAATGDILDAIVAGDQTTGLDVPPDGRLVAFSDFLDNRISVYELPSYETLAAGNGGRADERFTDLRK